MFRPPFSNSDGFPTSRFHLERVGVATFPGCSVRPQGTRPPSRGYSAASNVWVRRHVIDIRDRAILNRLPSMPTTVAFRGITCRHLKTMGKYLYFVYDNG